MTVEWNGDAFIRNLQETAAKGLLAAAKTLQNEERARRGIRNPRPYHNSAPKGQYPHLRTGAGRAGIMVSPSSLSEVINLLRVRVGYARNTFYSAVLESQGWKGLKNTLTDIRGQLGNVIATVK